jgi:geranylgeranyl pyrophosphate synthase
LLGSGRRSGDKWAPTARRRKFPDFTPDKQEVRGAVEDYLAKAFHAYADTEVREAAQYSVLGSGHRWRPIIVVAAGRIFREDALDIVLPTACAAELAHAASLVLDDLPSMDDAELRRGKPCTHRAFPQWAVDMVPVFLVNMAYDISLSNPRPSADQRVRASVAFSVAGLDMIAGQVADIRQDAERDEEARLLSLYTLKSGALYGASGRAGAILCGATEAETAQIYAACVDIGLSMQFMDDVADVTADVPEVGKRSGMDANKRTAVDLLGVEGARARSVDYQESALAKLAGFGPEADWLRSLACEVSWKAF